MRVLPQNPCGTGSQHVASGKESEPRIAPTTQADRESAETHRCLERARYYIASTLLRRRAEQADHVPPVRAWQAWLFAAWVVTVAGIHVATMLGLLQ